MECSRNGSGITTQSDWWKPTNKKFLKGPTLEAGGMRIPSRGTQKHVKICPALQPWKQEMLRLRLEREFGSEENAPLFQRTCV